MRLALARALIHGKYIVIDSDLTSLDARTREQVLRNVRDWLTKVEGVTVVVKGNKGDEGLSKFVDEFVRVEGRFSRVYSEINANSK